MPAFHPQPAYPAPVYPADVPIVELRTAELFVITGIRLWAAPHRDPMTDHPDWRGGFLAAGIEDDGPRTFDAFFRIVLATAQRSLDVRCLRCPRLGGDEAWFLQAVSLLQRNRTTDAETILHGWLPLPALRMAMRHAAAFAAAMTAVGLVVPHRPSGAAGRQGLGHGECAHRGLALVH